MSCSGVFTSVIREKDNGDHDGVGLALVVAACLRAQLFIVALHVVDVAALLLLSEWTAFNDTPKPRPNCGVL